MFTNIDIQIIFALAYISLIFLGFYGSYLYGRHTKKFTWGKYLSIIILPILCTLSLSYFYGLKIISLFVISCITGFILEYGFGFVYYKVFHRLLWEYKKFSVNGYTSWLVIPVWGVGGVYFAMIAKLLGM